MRTCIGCRRIQPSDLLTRLHCNNGHVTVEALRSNGRGAWLCRRPACLEIAIKRRAFDRAFKQATDPKSWDELKEKLSDAPV